MLFDSFIYMYSTHTVLISTSFTFSSVSLLSLKLSSPLQVSFIHSFFCFVLLSTEFIQDYMYDYMFGIIYWSTQLKTMTALPPESISGQLFNREAYSLKGPSQIHDWLLTGPVLCRSFAGSCGYCEIILYWLCYAQKKIFLCPSPYLLALFLFSHPLLIVFWALEEML